jgi:glycosyltransferase involved in cell wall biosynthesis
VKLINAELSESLPSIPPCTEGVQWVLVRLHGTPLGFVQPPAAGCGPETLRDLAIKTLTWQIARRAARPEPARRSPRQLSVTVAVCTRNGLSRLPACLDALEAIDYPRHLLDLVVVDNAPADDAIRRLVQRYSGIRYLREPRPGLDWARNRAALESRADIVAYTDDDVSVDPGWVKAIAEAFTEEPHAMCVTGLVVPDEIDTPAQQLFEKYGGFGRGFDRQVFRVAPRESAVRRFGGTGRFGTGANMAFRRQFFAEVGLFDPALDVGTPTNGGGDLEMFFRVLKNGHALVYEPAAIVRHRHRKSYAELRTQITNNGLGFYAYLVRTAHAYPEDRGAIARLALWWMWWWHARRLVRSLVRPSAFPIDLVVAELKGSFVGLRRYASARRHAARVVRQFGHPAAEISS